MPSKQRVSMAQLKVGVLGIVALSCITLLIFLLTGNVTWFQQKIPLHAYVSDAAGLTPGADVDVNGIPAGKVNSVTLSGERDPQKAVKVDFQVDQPMLKNIPSDSVAAIASGNLLGSTKYLQITRGTSPETIQPGATMKSSNTQEFDQLVQQGFGVLDSAQAILQRIQTIVADVENGQGSLGKLLVDPSLYDSLQATVNQVQLLTTTLNSKTGTVGHLINDNEFYNQIQGVVAKVDNIINGIQQGHGTAGLFVKDPKVYNDLDTSLKQLNTILTNLNQGKGTAGQLLASDKLGRQISTTLDKVNLTLDKVNSGQGTIGQLMVNPSLYNSLNGTTEELHGLLRDFRTNPKKFLSIKLHIF